MNLHKQRTTGGTGPYWTEERAKHPSSDSESSLFQSSKSNIAAGKTRFLINEKNWEFQYVKIRNSPKQFVRLTWKAWTHHLTCWGFSVSKSCAWLCTELRAWLGFVFWKIAKILKNLKNVEKIKWNLMFVEFHSTDQVCKSMRIQLKNVFLQWESSPSHSCGDQVDDLPHAASLNFWWVWQMWGNTTFDWRFLKIHEFMT